MTTHHRFNRAKPWQRQDGGLRVMERVPDERFLGCSHSKDSIPNLARVSVNRQKHNTTYMYMYMNEMR